MKKSIKSFFVFAVAALTLAGCQKAENEQPVQNEGQYKYSFTIAEDNTKAEIGDNSIEWVSGDQVGIFIGSLGEYTGYKGYAKIDVTTTPKMVVLYSNSAIPAGAMAYAYAPYDTENKNNDANRVKIVVNNIQSGSKISAMPLAGLPFEVEEDVEAGNQEGNGQIKFMNLGSLINFKIFSTNEEFQSETIQSIQFEATKTIAGIGYIDLTAVDMDDEGSLMLDMDTEENIVKVNEVMAVADDKESADPIKMVILPGVFEGTLTVVTDAATYTKAIPEREFARSHSRTFGLDLDKAERTAGVVEVVKTLPYDEDFASNQGDFTIENITVPAGLPYVWSHGSHNTDVYMQATAYYNSTRYATESMLVSPWIDLTEVAAAEVSFSNAYRYVTTPADFFTFWVKTDEEGSEWTQETINNYGAGNFAWGDAVVNLTEYVGNKVKVAFKYVSGGTSTDTGTWEITNFSAHVSKADPGLSFATTEFAANVGEDFTAPTLTNPHNLTVTYASSDTEIAEVDETSGAVTIGNKVGTVTITASFAGNDDFNAGSASYTIKVTDPEATSVTDVINLAFTGVSGTSYTNWSGKTGLSGAVYAGNSAGGNNAVQFRSNNNNSGIVTTTSGGYAKKVTVTWNSNTASGRTLNIYGKNSAYSSASDLYGSETQGTLLGTIVNGTSTSLEISGNYAFIGLRSNKDAMYIDEIQIEWSGEAAPADPVITLSNIPTTNISADGDVVTINYSIENPVEGVTVQASAGADTWVNGFDYSDAGAISFVVDPKTTPGTRTATITVSYTGAEDKTFQITQDGYSSGNEEIAEFIFNTDAGLAVLGIEKPATGKGTELGDEAYTVNGVSLTATSGSTATRVWNSSGSTDLRIYKNGGTLTFSVDNSKNITSIVMTGGTTNKFTANVGTFSNGTWAGSASSVTLTATDTGKIDTITVTYE